MKKESKSTSIFLNHFREILDHNKKNGIAFYEMAARLDLSRSCIYHLAQRNSGPTLDTVDKIADKLGIEACDLITDRLLPSYTPLSDEEKKKKKLEKDLEKGFLF